MSKPAMTCAVRLIRRRCCKECLGWSVFDAAEIQRCDECDLFESDGQAVAHVLTCDECSQHLFNDSLVIQRECVNAA